MDCDGHCWIPDWDNGKYGLRCIYCNLFQEG